MSVFKYPFNHSMVELGAILREQPADLKPGDIWDQSIDEILTSWHSVDGAGQYCTWSEKLAMKRNHGHYEDLKQSLVANGFIRPVTVRTNQYSGNEDLMYGDGHHRLAAAIDLGMTHIPVEFVGDNRGISADSGYWSAGDPVSTHNELTMW